MPHFSIVPLLFSYPLVKAKSHLFYMCMQFMLSHLCVLYEFDTILSLHCQSSLLFCSKWHKSLICFPFTSSSCQITPLTIAAFQHFPSAFFFSSLSWVIPSIPFVFDCYCDHLYFSDEHIVHARGPSHNFFYVCLEGPIDWLINNYFLWTISILQPFFRECHIKLLMYNKHIFLIPEVNRGTRISC